MASEIPSFGQALENYANLISHNGDPKTIAEKTLELNKLAHNVMQAASPLLRTTASDLEHLLTAPVSVHDKAISILAASEHFSDNPAELKDLLTEYGHNQEAFRLLCNELTLLSSAAQKPQS